MKNKKMLDNYVYPKEALRLLKMGQEFNKPVYIYGATSYGKTSLVKHFLQDKDYVYYFAEQLSVEKVQELEQLSNVIIVIDDFHEIEYETRYKLYNELYKLTIKPDIWLIMIGRGAMPQFLRNKYFDDPFPVITERNLCLDRHEALQLFKLWKVDLKEQFEHVFVESLGNPLFLSLVAGCTKKEGKYSEDIFQKATKGLWDILLENSYKKWPVELQDFVLKMSIVDEFDLALAKMITGRSDVERVLEILKRIGNMLEEKTDNQIYEGTVYQFREPLHRMISYYIATGLTAMQKQTLYTNAGLFYSTKGNIIKALEMYSKCDAYDRIEQLLIDQTRISPRIGFMRELRDYFLAIPKERALESPELMCALSCAYAIQMQVKESKYWFDQLNQYVSKETGSQRKNAIALLFYLNLALPNINVTQLMDWFNKYRDEIINHNIHIYNLTLTFGSPSIINGYRDISLWVKNHNESAKQYEEFFLEELGTVDRGVSDLFTAEVDFEKAEDNYFTATMLSNGRMKADISHYIEGVVVSDGINVWQSIIRGDTENALMILDSLRQKIIKEKYNYLLPVIDTFMTRVYLYHGKEEKVREWLKQSPDENVEFLIERRFDYLTKIRAYIYLGEYLKAHELIVKMLYICKVMNRNYMKWECNLLLAIVYYRMDNNSWKSVLKETLLEIEEHNYVRLITKEASIIEKMIKEINWKTKNPSFKEKVMNELFSVSLNYPNYLKCKKERIKLSEKALEILKLQSLGYSIGEIADRLCVQPETIKYHNHQTYIKLGVKGKAAAIAEAYRLGILNHE